MSSVRKLSFFSIPAAVLFLFVAVACDQKGPGGSAGSPAAGSAGSQEHRVDQKNKQFLPGEIFIKVGDTVNFVNEDSFFHNVYSLSDTKVFDLGSYPKGEGRKVKFDSPGEVLVECAIHDQMKMKVIVK